MHLKPADQHLLKFLRQQVDRFEAEMFKTDRNPSAHNNLALAREELRQFVKKLRKEGHNI